MTISADASDNVAVAQVEFLVNGNVVGSDSSSPYSISWDSTTLANGPATITARATDTAANSTTSAGRSVTIDNSGPPDTTPPAVDLTAPADGATVSGSVTISADASDNVAVAQVEFLVNGNVVGSDSSSPYSIGWDSTALANGPATLTARATDAAGNSTTSAARGVTIDNSGPPPPDTTPPDVGLTAPADGATVSGNVTISADASDNVAVAQVEFLVNGNVVGSDSSSPYSIGWDSTTLANGPATITARATDTAANSTTSASRSVTIANGPPGDTTPPSVTLADPGAFLRGTKTLTATASDASGVAQVVFEISPMGQSSWSAIATDSTAPYSVDFTTTTVADGTYDLRAVATDVPGNSGSSVVTARLIDNTGATGSITSPTSGAVVSGTTTVTATATDAGSGVSQITFQRSPAGQNSWTAIAAADTTEPYSVNWTTTSLTDGNYDLRGVILDDAGNQSTTPVTTVVVRNRHTFVPVADAYVNASVPSTNFGASTSIRVDAEPVLRSYLRFNIQVSAPILRATLRVFTASSSTTGYQVRGVASNTWVETTITFANAPAVSGTVTGSSGSFSSGVWTQVDVTSLVTAPGLVTFGLTTPSSTSKSFSSREGSNPPQLIVETG
jgi:archaellum component FlaF (FlaF/FlaG flagellin family)